MAHTKPPVIKTAAAAWRDAFRAIVAMPVVAGIAFVIVLGTLLASYALIDDGSLAFLGGLRVPVISIGSSIVQAILLAPLAIAVHRFVLLGEITSRYPIEPWSSRFQRFAGFAVLFKILWLMPNAMRLLFERVGFGGFVQLVVFIAIMVIVARRVILFPGIAIDAPGATWRNASLDTKGNSWRVAFIFVLTVLPPMVIVLSYFWLLVGFQSHYSDSSLMAFTVIRSVVGTATLSAFAAAASHIYRARAELMMQPSG